MKDMHNNIKVVSVVAPISPAATGTITGAVVDRANFASVEFLIASGAMVTTGFTLTPIVKSGSATGSLSAVADSNLIGTEADAAFAGTETGIKKIGYKGNDRYVSCDLVAAASATGVHAASVVLGDPRKAPQA